MRIKNHWCQVFHGETRRVRFRTFGASEQSPRKFAVESLPNSMSEHTAFSRGDLHYFDIDLEAAWQEVQKLIPDIEFPVRWSDLKEQHPNSNKFLLTETKMLEFPAPILGIYNKGDSNAKIVYEATKPTPVIIATLVGCGISAAGIKETVLNNLCKAIEALYARYEALNWSETMISSPIGDGYAKSEMRVLKPMKRKNQLSDREREQMVALRTCLLEESSCQ